MADDSATGEDSALWFIQRKGAKQIRLAKEQSDKIKGKLSLAHFGKQEGCYDRSSRDQWAVVDAHLHVRPFGGTPVPFPDLMDWLRRAGILFTVLNGIGQRLPVESPCAYYLDCPGTKVTPSVKDDFDNAESVLDANESLATNAQGPYIVTAMTFPDLAHPEGILPRMKLMEQEFPGKFTWMGEVNVVKQALFNNSAGEPIPLETIPRWAPFMAHLREEHIPIAFHSDLGSDEEPLKYLPIMDEILRLFPDNKMVWLHLAGLSKQLDPIEPALLSVPRSPLRVTDHIKVLRERLERHPNLFVDLSWDVLYDNVFSDPAKRPVYVELFNEFPTRFITGTDFVAASYKDEAEYRKELASTSDILKDVDEEAFRLIGLGQNFFDLLGLPFKAPVICAGYVLPSVGSVTASASASAAANASASAANATAVAGDVEIHSAGKPKVALTLVPCLIVLTILVGLMGTCALGAMAKEEKKEEEMEAGVTGSTAAQTLLNIIMNLVGEGMLSLPFGVAAGTGVISAIMISVAFCSFMGYTFHLMGRMCYATGQTNHKACGEQVSGPILAQTMSVVLMIKTLFTCLTYSIVIGQSFSKILHFWKLTGPFTTQGGVLIVIACVVLLPLCCQKDLSILSYTSFIGICGEIFVVFVMQLRYYDGSYTPEGHFYSLTDAAYQPDFGTAGAQYYSTSVTTFVLLGSLSTAYIAHYNAPKYYTQLRDRSPEKFAKVVLIAFGYTATIYAWIMSVGYLTFGKACDGLILNNYSEQDVLATAARVAIGFAVIFGFPLAFTALRDSTIGVFALQKEKATTFYSVTMALLGLIILIGCFVTDLGVVNSLGGAIFGSIITLVFPGLLVYLAVKKGNEHFGGADRNMALLVIFFGIILIFFGSTIVILKSYFPATLGL